ncbi:hypothetical protein GCM10007036_38030 [Alsobacter metallidurans]|uniref:Lipoprotein n=1 Tax=Alsobacter metallidurans TaxID=340221 RepID=A0A917I9B3_9HYPH|nr:hypothetical protein [Alsobacter metallidurans]GGH28671.1 hypothetical protein GCM10007036_38030 [Alsobacter metallidurans]
MSTRLSGFLGWAAAAALACSLAGCQATDGPTARYEAPGVPVALDTLEGAPEAVKTRVSAEISTQATARRIELVDSQAQPRYRLKGYLTAYPTETGDTTLAVVWDVFDAANKRQQRVTTTTVAKGQGDDPWSRIGETQIAKATSQSMNQVAAFLAGQTPGAGPATASLEPAKALGFAAGE